MRVRGILRLGPAEEEASPLLRTCQGAPAALWTPHRREVQARFRPVEAKDESEALHSGSRLLWWRRGGSIERE